MNINIKKIIIALITFCIIFLYYYIFKQSYSLIKYPYNNVLYNFGLLISMISFLIGLGCLLFGIFLLIKNIKLKKKLFSKTIIILLIIPILSYFFISSFLEGLIIEGESWNKQLVGNDKDEHGCIGSAGYTWCEVKNKCLRTWEEECIEEEEKNKKMTDEEAKQYFHATEIINNNLLESIEFWTEAECSYLNTKYNYKVPDGYYISAEYCSEKEVGTHGGCPSCIMSKIVLRKGSSIPESNFSNSPEIIPTIKMYCSQFNDYNYMSGFYVNIDYNKKGIFAMCNGYPDYFYFTTLYNENSKWTSIMNGDVSCENNCTMTEKPEAKDFDNDGVNEITYTLGTAGADSGVISHYLYSFQFKDWFICNQNWRGDSGYGKIICGNYDKFGDFIEKKDSQWFYSETEKNWIKN